MQVLVGTCSRVTGSLQKNNVILKKRAVWLDMQWSLSVKLFPSCLETSMLCRELVREKRLVKRLYVYIQLSVHVTKTSHKYLQRLQFLDRTGHLEENVLPISRNSFRRISDLYPPINNSRKVVTSRGIRLRHYVRIPHVTHVPTACYVNDAVYTWVFDSNCSSNLAL